MEHNSIDWIRNVDSTNIDGDTSMSRGHFQQDNNDDDDDDDRNWPMLLDDATRKRTLTAEDIDVYS